MAASETGDQHEYFIYPGNSYASEEPDIFNSASMVVRVAQELVDVAQESIVAQHRLTQTLLKRQEMVTEHLEQIERLMNRDNHAAL